MAGIKKLNAEHLQEEKILVKVGAPWCGPCRQIAPILESLAEDGYAVYDVDIDVEAEFADKYGIRSVPTLMVFENGEVTKSEVGFRTREQLEEMLK